MLLAGALASVTMAMAAPMAGPVHRAPSLSEPPGFQGVGFPTADSTEPTLRQCWVHVSGLPCCAFAADRINTTCKANCDDKGGLCVEWSCPGLVDPDLSETIDTWLLRNEPGGCLIEEELRVVLCPQYPPPAGDTDRKPVNIVVRSTMNHDDPGNTLDTCGCGG